MRTVITTIHEDDDCAILQGDCLEFLRSLPDSTVDMVMCSPPYEDARTYGIDFKIKGEDWVKWAFERYVECYRVCKGLTAWVVEGKTRDFKYSCTPGMLMTDLHRAGISLRKPLAFHRVGIPGSGGPDWFRNDYEFIITATHGRLPWSDNTAMGHPPVCEPGGNPSHRNKNGDRINKKVTMEQRNLVGAHRARRQAGQAYKPPVLANPGNVIDTSDRIYCGALGGNNMGSKLAHENEAPYPESLCNHLIRSFCPPGGMVLDIFGGSGTTMAAALKAGRKCISLDLRASQTDIMVKRLAEVRAAMQGAAA